VGLSIKFQGYLHFISDVPDSQQFPLMIILTILNKIFLFRDPTVGNDKLVERKRRIIKTFIYQNFEYKTSIIKTTNIKQRITKH